MAVRSLAAVLSCLVFSMMAVQAEETDRAPETFRVKFETSTGDFVIEVQRKWSPLGADQFYRLVQEKFYDEARFFRVVPGFVVQFGIAGDPEVHAKWGETNIKDEPVIASNMRGYVTYAKSRDPNSRTTQLFINLQDNQRLDEMGFSPFGRVTEGLDVVDKITAEYGEQPVQAIIKSRGNTYLKQRFPRLDFIKKATVLTEGES